MARLFASEKWTSERAAVRAESRGRRIHQDPNI